MRIIRAPFALLRDGLYSAWHSGSQSASPPAAFTMAAAVLTTALTLFGLIRGAFSAGQVSQKMSTSESITLAAVERVNQDTARLISDVAGIRADMARNREYDDRRHRRHDARDHYLDRRVSELEHWSAGAVA
jgi:hypothetical protein